MKKQPQDAGAYKSQYRLTGNQALNLRRVKHLLSTRVAELTTA